ncbi:MAG: hypothetical protein HKP25_05070 [Marinicaulis sp.]|nr:hypothetical protein [Marinicaulis sp.]
MMPEMDGPATMTAIRTIEALSHIPIAFMTARGQPHEVQEYHEMGAVRRRSKTVCRRSRSNL